MTDLRRQPGVSDPLLGDLGPLLAATRLRNVLRVNAVVSGGTGLVAALAAGPLGDLLDVPALAVGTVGAGLVVFAGGVAAASGARHRRLADLTRLIAAADASWVLATVVLVALGTFSTAGIVLVGAAGVVVATFAALELRGAARVLAAGATPDVVPPFEAISTSAEADVPPATAWQIITDHELYGRLAPSLSRVEPTAENGPGLTRRCVNGKGQAWSETCTLWDEGHAYAVSVDTSSYPYPLTAMHGRWSVDRITERRSRFGMDFAFRPRPGPRGRGFAWAMHLAFPLVLRRILRGWKAAA